MATALCISTGAPLAQDLALPADAERSFATTQDPGVYLLPVGPWRAGEGLPTRRIEGAVRVEAWRIDGTGLTPFQLVQPLRDALVAAGYDIVLDCAARTCGGFDFRFATTVLPAPEMFVDLARYHFVSALAPQGAISLLASRDSGKAYVQIIRAGGAASGGDTSADAPPAPPARKGDIIAALESAGHVILDDLVFQTGAAALGDDRVASLDALAAYLQDNPARRVLFVGHTDAVGSLEGNQALSRRRAQAAVAYLRDRHAIPDSQIGAAGVGYLSPVASNLTEAGREANRRVEAVLISTE
ncbi:OmpA family protein [Pseudoponticoccus marisrubri]|uniref:Cell envelope biogenesis protein OmpA n=1 Tax=Pseudoponticoccus marisrubri TaxID=1685382 RepID=A0A0W7WIL4_9RHOB|nr:OmpA family protein [Pseudoponticoccus marisrubri]KUF10464.1 cell envelope biogenesis protein OmpA [Pseudoponticoccus marisrubri]